jgi:hypothetical protein
VKKYKVLVSQALKQDGFEFELNYIASLGWKPILPSAAQASPQAPVSVTVIFEQEEIESIGSSLT